MESLTRLVSESFARHGFDRPMDYRRLQWSRWFPCESPHSLLFVPSRPGVFAVAEEITEIGTKQNMWDRASEPVRPSEARLDFADSAATPAHRRMLAVLQFCEDDDMAFVLDRMFSRENPMRARLASGLCFVRFVVLEDWSQRRSICNALNQWLISSSEATTGIGAHFATSLELTKSSVAAGHVHTTAAPRGDKEATISGPELVPASPSDSGAAANIHRPSPFPSGF